MSEYFQRVANDVLKASEEITARMEDGITAMLGDLSKTAGGGGGATPPPEFDGDEGFEIEEEFMGSPLNGIADSVLGDLMHNSVRTNILFFVFLFGLFVEEKELPCNI